MKWKTKQMLQQLRKNKQPDEQTKIDVERTYILSDRSNFYIKEAYNALRTNTTFALAEIEEPCKVIIVTSAVQSEGKSITAINLAISYAELGDRVLLIDCDLRRPKISRLLNLKSQMGLSNVLIKSDLLQKAISRSAVGAVDVLSSGDVPPNPSELLASGRMKKLIESLRDSYDYIILDTPPVNVVTDACVLVPVSSGVLFVVRADYSERGAVVHAVEQLEYSRAKILGFTLNGAEDNSNFYGYSKRRYSYRRYSYYHYNRYGYGYGSGYSYGYTHPRPMEDTPEDPPADQEREP